MNLARLRELLKAATPAPWEFLTDTIGGDLCARIGPLNVCPATAHGNADGELISELRNSAESLIAGCEERDRLAERVQGLFDAIAHGDEAHRVWLHHAILAHFAEEPIQPPTGSGNKERLRAEYKSLEDKYIAAMDENASLKAANAELYKTVLMRNDEIERRTAEYIREAQATDLELNRLKARLEKAVAVVDAARDLIIDERHLDDEGKSRGSVAVFASAKHTYPLADALAELDQSVKP